MTRKELHRKLLKRLIPAWLVLSAVIGFVVYFIELERIDDLVLNLATEESKYFTGEYRNHPGDAGIVNERLFQKRSTENIEKGHFVVVELYDREKRLVGQAIRPGRESVEQEMDRRRHDMLMGKDAGHRNIYIGERLFLLVLVPIKTAGGGITGYFEGVYEADPKTLKDIRARIMWSVIQVVAVISVTTFLLFPLLLSLNRELLKRSEELYHADLGMLEILGNAISKRDSDTNTHNYRVTIYTIRLAEAVNLTKDRMQGLIKGAFLHDLGKIAISDNILLKPDPLTPEETEVMRTHVQHGVEIIRDYHWLAEALDVVACHHEKFDGKGFLKGMQGYEIPLHARIFAICDVFDALTSRRPYKEPYGYHESIEMIRQLSGTHFDPVLVDAFSAISRGLYEEINRADEDYLKKALKKLIDRYFDADTV